MNVLRCDLCGDADRKIVKYSTDFHFKHCFDKDDVTRLSNITIWHVCPVCKKKIEAFLISIMDKKIKEEYSEKSV